ncbi:hypothetical protein HY418_01460 [Candidatus Kaiserbacteria bacterium]|nr:hypothetical protein [Candidatus Kaiserbacteria bacterium]
MEKEPDRKKPGARFDGNTERPAITPENESPAEPTRDTGSDIKNLFEAFRSANPDNHTDRSWAEDSERPENG